MRELVARMRAVLRRVPADSSAAAGPSAGEAITVGAITIDPVEHRVLVNGVDTSMPLKEFDLLRLLMINAGRVLPRETLIDRVWGHDYVGDTKTLDVHIKRLRAKVEADPSTPTAITTVRGVGYKFERPRL
jgi:two-component system response regulator RegX3